MTDRSDWAISASEFSRAVKATANSAAWPSVFKSTEEEPSENLGAFLGARPSVVVFDPDDDVFEQNARLASSIRAMREKTRPRPRNPRVHPATEPRRWMILVGAAAAGSLVILVKAISRARSRR